MQLLYAPTYLEVIAVFVTPVTPEMVLLAQVAVSSIVTNIQLCNAQPIINSAFAHYKYVKIIGTSLLWFQHKQVYMVITFNIKVTYLVI